jgi:hypothetical protein
LGFPFEQLYPAENCKNKDFRKYSAFKVTCQYILFSKIEYIDSKGEHLFPLHGRKNMRGLSRKNGEREMGAAGRKILSMKKDCVKERIWGII